MIDAARRPDAAVLRRPQLGGALTPAAVVAGSVAAGVAVGHGRPLWIAAAAVATAGFAVGAASWRRSLVGLLVFLPFSGIPVIAAYPHTGPAVLLKDACFVLPAYLGFAVAGRRRGATALGRPLVVAAGLFAAVVAVQVLNPSLPRILVGLIGLKVWLLYVPLCVLGFELVRTRAELRRLLGLMSVLAIVPAAIGIVEAVLLASGKSAFVYGLYGNAAGAVTQRFAEFTYGAGSIRRVPSTFSFGAQYYGFVADMIAVSYAWWRLSPRGTRGARFGGAVWLLLLVAAFLSGARAAFFMIPALVGLTFLLERGLRFSPARLLALVGAPLAALVVLGASGAELARRLLETAAHEFDDLIVHGFREALSLTWVGLGTGSDTAAARYAMGGIVAGPAGKWFESWYVKALVELGVVGLLLFLFLLATLLAGAFRRHRAIRDRRLRAVSAALLALLVWHVACGVKSGYVDLDPTNVYFWLLAGVLAKVAVLDQRQEEPAP